MWDLYGGDDSNPDTEPRYGDMDPHFPPLHTLTSTVAMGNAALLLSVMRSYCFIALTTNWAEGGALIRQD